MNLPGRTMICLFNWGETPRTLSCRLARRTRITDYWTGEDLGEHEGDFRVENLGARSAQLFETRV